MFASIQCLEIINCLNTITVILFQFNHTSKKWSWKQHKNPLTKLKNAQGRLVMHSGDNSGNLASAFMTCAASHTSCQCRDRYVLDLRLFLPSFFSSQGDYFMELNPFKNHTLNGHFSNFQTVEETHPFDEAFCCS